MFPQAIEGFRLQVKQTLGGVDGVCMDRIELFDHTDRTAGQLLVAGQKDLTKAALAH